jgi:hypothetical protein
MKAVEALLDQLETMCPACCGSPEPGMIWLPHVLEPIAGG